MPRSCEGAKIQRLDQSHVSQIFSIRCSMRNFFNNLTTTLLIFSPHCISPRTPNQQKNPQSISLEFPLQTWNGLCSQPLLISLLLHAQQPHISFPSSFLFSSLNSAAQTQERTQVNGLSSSHSLGFLLFLLLLQARVKFWLKTSGSKSCFSPDPSSVLEVIMHLRNYLV